MGDPQAEFFMVEEHTGHRWWRKLRDHSSCCSAATTWISWGGGVFDGGAYIWDTVVGDCHKASAAVPRLPIHFRQKTNKPTENWRTSLLH